MITNAELNEMGLAPVDRTKAMPAATEIRGKNGGLLGTLQYFTGSKSANDIKAEYKAVGKKGKELSRLVTETLRGEKDLRQQVALAWLQMAFQQGYTGNTGKLLTNTGVLSLVKVAPEVVKAPEVKPEAKKVVSREEALAALGLSADEIAEIEAARALKNAEGK